MTTLAKPAIGATVIDAEFGTTIRRITAVAGSGANAAIVPMYTTISAWNADESLLILYSVAGGVGHQLYDGKTYKLLRSLDINPADIEQVYWDTSDPDILYYVDDQEFIRYHVNAGTQDKLHSFSGLCGSDSVSNGDDPMFTSWDSHRLGLYCGNQMFIYDISTDSVLGPRPVSGTPPAQVAPTGTLAYLEAGSGQVLDANLNLVRSLGLQVPDNHASLGQLANGHDTWNGAVYDDGNDDTKSNVGILVTWDMTDGTGGAVIGPKTGWPYPPDGHISAMAYKRPGWILCRPCQTTVRGFRGRPCLGWRISLPIPTRERSVAWEGIAAGARTIPCSATGLRRTRFPAQTARGRCSRVIGATARRSTATSWNCPATLPRFFAFAKSALTHTTAGRS